MESQLKNISHQLFRATISQILCVLILLIGILITRSFFPEIFKEFSTWYEKNLLVDTSVNEVLENENIKMSSDDIVL